MCKEGETEQNRSADMSGVVKETTVDGKDSFGPWMQVSYGRYGRNNVGTKNFGRRDGNVGSSGGVGTISKMNVANRTDEVVKGLW